MTRSGSKTLASESGPQKNNVDQGDVRWSLHWIPPWINTWPIRAKALLDKYVPGASTNPMIAMAKGMSLRMLLSLPQAKQFGLTEEKAESLLQEINKRTG
jgi:hypothetical protein